MMLRSGRVDVAGRLLLDWASSGRWRSDVGLAAVLVVLVGWGLVLALAGTVPGDLVLIGVGGVLAGVGLVGLLVGDWIDGLALVALTVPVPALYTAGELRVATVAPVTAAVVLAWALRWGASRSRLDLGRLPLRAIGLLMAGFVVATAFSRHPTTSARELVNLGVLLGLLVGATQLLVRCPRDVPRLVRMLAAVGAVVGALSVLEMVGVIPGRFPRAGTPFNRAALGFGQPNGLGLFLAMVLPLAVHQVRSARTLEGRVVAALGMLAVILGLVGTFSRGSWLAVLAGTSLFLVTGDWRSFVRIWIGAILVAIVVDVAAGGILRDTVERTIGDWVIEQRAALMLAGILMFLESPVIGVGPGSFAGELDRVGGQVTQLWDVQPTPHNAYVQMAAETGILGLGAFLVFLGTVVWMGVGSVRRARKRIGTGPEVALRRALLWSFATVCFAGFVVWPFSHGTGQVVMILVALAIAADRRPLEGLADAGGWT